MDTVKRSTRALARHHVVVTVGILLTSCSVESVQEAPKQQKSAANRPSPPSRSQLLPPELPSAPPLTGAGTQARESARAFLGWAERSTSAQKEEGRARIHAAAANNDIIDALAEEARQAQSIDHSRALMAIGILGETGSPRAIEHLRSLLWQTLPTTGQVVDGEIAERAGLEMLEAKAVSGLAYIKDPAAEQEVLRAVAEHPSYHVRAEAVAFYRANHGDTAATRSILASYVRQGEERFIDRPIRSPGEHKDSVNKKLQDYLLGHPEITPPPPVRLPPKDKKPHVDQPADPPPLR
jgi:hypothetical protein